MSGANVTNQFLLLARVRRQEAAGDVPTRY
jgi:hypothetical protein